MTISYEIILTIVNLTNNQTKTFVKDFDYDLTDNNLYDNHHIIANKVKMFTLFKSEISQYCAQNAITVNNIDIDEFNINSKTDRVDVYFEPGDGDDPNQISLEPNIKCYVYPKHDALQVPELTGKAYDDTTIIWSWEDDGQAHYLVSEAIDIDNEDQKDKIIAQIPIGRNNYTETGLESDTAYTRRLIAYNSEQTSGPSRATTIRTATAPIDQSLEQYEIPKNYDYTSDDVEREIIQENLEAFHSGVGDYNDLKVYKQMDADFYQKFKAYIQLRGSRTQRERRYDSVGFNYKVCLESTETIEEQKGEVTFDIDVFPIEKITIKDYMYSSQPVTICARMRADVLVKKPKEDNEDIECPLQQPKWEKVEREVPNEENPKAEPEPFDGELTVVLSLDISGSMVQNDGNGMRWDIVKEASKELIDRIEAHSKDGIPLAGKVKYCLTFWASTAMTVAGYTAEEAKEVIDSVTFKQDSNGVYLDKSGTVNAWGWTPSNLTNHGAGLSDWIGQPGVTNAVVELFFTDGFANTENGYSWTFHAHPDDPGAYGSAGHISRVYESITNGYDSISEQGVKCFTLFGANYNTDCDIAVNECWTNPSLGMKEHIINFSRNIYNRHYAKAASIDQIAYSQYSKTNILNSMWNGLKALIDSMQKGESDRYQLPDGTITDMKYHLPDGTPTNDPTRQEPDGWEFKGWEDTDEKLSLSVGYNIDECKWARVYFPPLDEDPWTVTINETLTPIVYARNEQRAIIPSDSIIVDRNFDSDETIRQEAIQVDSRSIQEMILEGVQSTPAWEDGYNQLVEAYTDEEKEHGNYIIRGLIIKDTYKYADEDKLPSVDFSGNENLEDGYVGSINVYADINKLNTSAFGDDIYAIGEDKYVWLSGYTDAIIYDGERIESLELNASNTMEYHNDPRDHQTEVLLSPAVDYSNYLWSRKPRISTGAHDIPYTDDNTIIRHVVDIIDKDKDVYITDSNALEKVGDWALFVPEDTDISDTNTLIRGVASPAIEFLTEDVITHNDEHYQSPILNYRFNYEDPDAYTSYYELLPTCDPSSTYKNIVLLHIYYARNIYIQDENQVSGSKTAYIQSFGNDNIATRVSPFYSMSQEIEGQTYFRDDYIDDYLWFQAKPHLETRPYYDEKPNPGMDSFYGNVNGRYREGNKSGKKDLRVVIPQFNLPTTIDAENIKIYIMITEFYPDTALVAYQWEHPSSEKDSITNVNGDYVTFSSDSLTYKDIVYNELLQTVTSKPIELFDNKTTMQYFELTKPLSQYIYDHYYIELFSDNSDVLALNYPSEVIFDENGKAEFGANFKGVVNATTKWSPRIHNGYYYLNQHEYYAYSEFDVEADFEEYSEENFKTINGYVSIDVDLLRRAGDPEHYDIVKNTRSELMQNEKEFVWVNGKGLTMQPKIDGEYYKEYTACTYISPVILFPNILTSAGKLKVDYHLEDGSDDLPMKVRSYNIEEGKWSDWVDFTNDSVPNVPLSHAYQLKFTIAASVVNNDKTFEDYLCCYLDWVDDGDTQNHTNCVTITDHLQAGPDKSDGIFNSKIIDFGCESTITIDMFASNIKKNCELYVAIENNNKNKLLLENVVWTKVNEATTFTTRFFRYRIVIPYGEKVYWVHKSLLTKESDVLLPYIEQIQMTGDYTPADTHDSFQEVQSFEIITDGKSHRIFPSIYDIISGDVHAKDFNDNEIQYVRINSTDFNIHLNYADETKNKYPGVNVLSTPIYATADFEAEISVKNTPYIFASMDPLKSMDVLKITKGTPQQYCPITMEDADGVPYKEVFDVDPTTMQKTETFEILNADDQHYIKLSRNDFDIKTLTVTLNDEPFESFKIVNNLIIFEINPNINDIIKIKYNILNSFYTEIDYENNKTQMTIYSDYDSELAKQDEIKNLVPIVDHHTYTECRLGQIYANGYKQSIDKQSTVSDVNWKYDAGLDAIYYSYNLDSFSIIINNLIPVTSYEMQIVAYSTDADQDIIGFVLGYAKDSGGVYHTLSYLVSFGSDYTFDDNNIAIVLDYGRTDAKILASTKVEHLGYTNWNDMVNGIKFFAKKTTSKAQCKISEWNNPETWNDDTLLTIDLDTDELQPFVGAVGYGFCVRSQQDTYFTNPTFAGNVDRTITVEEQMNTLKHKYKVYFETNKTNNKFIATNLSLNPVYRTDYKGFIYLTDEHNEPYTINIYRNPKYIKAGGYDKIDISIECLDYEGNPVISKDIDIDCEAGILNFDNTNSKHLTDINGVIHVLYESAVEPCTDIIKARTVTNDGKVIEASVDIINE